MLYNTVKPYRKQCFRLHLRVRGCEWYAIICISLTICYVFCPFSAQTASNLQREYHIICFVHAVYTIRLGNIAVNICVIFQEMLKHCHKLTNCHYIIITLTSVQSHPILFWQIILWLKNLAYGVLLHFITYVDGSAHMQ